MKTNEAEIEKAIKRKNLVREETTLRAADLNFLYCPPLWRSSTGFLSRDSLSQVATGGAEDMPKVPTGLTQMTFEEVSEPHASNLHPVFTSNLHTTMRRRYVRRNRENSFSRIMNLSDHPSRILWTSILQLIIKYQCCC